MPLTLRSLAQQPMGQNYALHPNLAPELRDITGSPDGLSCTPRRLRPYHHCHGPKLRWKAYRAAAVKITHPIPEALSGFCALAFTPTPSIESRIQILRFQVPPPGIGSVEPQLPSHRHLPGTKLSWLSPGIEPGIRVCCHYTILTRVTTAKTGNRTQDTHMLPLHQPNQILQFPSRRCFLRPGKCVVQFYSTTNSTDPATSHFYAVVGSVI